jgi:hypothetical protein
MEGTDQRARNIGIDNLVPENLALEAACRTHRVISWIANLILNPLSDCRISIRTVADSGRRNFGIGPLNYAQSFWTQLENDFLHWLSTTRHKPIDCILAGRKCKGTPPNRQPTSIMIKYPHVIGARW